MNLIDELDGQIANLWKFWSVRISVLSATCSTTVATYMGFKVLDPSLVKYVPMWAVCACATGSVFFTSAAVLVRGIRQPPPKDS